MKPAFLLFISLTLMIPSMAQKKTYSYLALGDSYTIGESVPVYENFPYQAVQMLRQKGKAFQAPEIVAKTGWTTDELSAGIDKTSFLPSYDIVSLLIGVTISTGAGLRGILLFSLRHRRKNVSPFAGGKANHVFADGAFPTGQHLCSG